jgi:tetratricopeptide (TPR) repeat protein
MNVLEPAIRCRRTMVVTVLISCVLMTGSALARQSTDAGANDPRLDTVYVALATAQEEGDPEAIDAALRERLRVVREIYGPAHVETARAMMTLSVDGTADYVESQALRGAAVAIFRTALDEAERSKPGRSPIGASGDASQVGSGDDPVLKAMIELIEAEYQLDRYQPSSMLDRAFARAMSASPPELRVFDGPHPVAAAMARAGRWDEAIAFYSRYPAGSEQAALALLMQVTLEESSGEEFDDITALRAALTILAARPDTEEHVLAHVALAFTSHLRGAEFQTEQIVTEMGTLLGPGHQLIADFLRQQSAWVGLNELGTLRIEQTSEDCRRTAAEALELNRNAFDIEQGLLPADSFELVLPTAILAEAYMQAGDLETAEAHYLEASRIAALYVAPVETVEVLADLGAVRLRRQLWTDALLDFDDGLAMLAEAEASGELTDSRRDVIRYRLNRGRGDAAFQLADYAAAASGYGRALPGSPIVECFAGRPDSPGYDWTCGHLWSGDVCDAQSIMDETAFLEAHAKALTATGRSAHATRLAWFASLAVIEHTRNRYSLDPRGRSEFGRRQNTHRTFVSAAWDGS